MSLLTFASPGLAIAAGVAVTVPVAIHLLMRRRRKPVEWAAMELLREALRRVERKRRVERWLLLAVRCLSYRRGRAVLPAESRNRVLCRSADASDGHLPGRAVRPLGQDRSGREGQSDQCAGSRQRQPDQPVRQYPLDI